jgi:hypothetical protein
LGWQAHASFTLDFLQLKEHQIMSSANITFRTLTTGLAAALAAATAAATSAAAEYKPYVAVPSHGDASVKGCWHADRNLYGPYRLRFCLGSGQSGSYRVTGGGLYCHGELTWSRDHRGRVNVSLARSSCGAGQDWTADRFTCDVTSGGYADTGKPRIMVPAPGRGLSCTYMPVVWGYPWKSFQASRS